MGTAARRRSRGNHGGLDVACRDGDGLIGLEECVTLEASPAPVTTLLRALRHPTSYGIVKREKEQRKAGPSAGPPSRACEGFLPATPADGEEAVVPSRPAGDRWLPVRWPWARSLGAAPPQSCTASARTSSVTAKALNRPPELPKKSQRGGVPDCQGAGVAGRTPLPVDQPRTWICLHPTF